jgi:hypothetical protein
VARFDVGGSRGQSGLRGRDTPTSGNDPKADIRAGSRLSAPSDILRDSVCASRIGIKVHWRFPFFPGNVALRRGTDWNACVTYWEWFKLIVTAFLISCATTATVFAFWYAIK